MKEGNPISIKIQKVYKPMTPGNNYKLKVSLSLKCYNLVNGLFVANEIDHVPR